TLHIPAVTPRKGGKVYMLGYKKSLKWTADGDGINITIPAKLAANLPCEYAWGFEIEIGSDYG
ncbi:MAG: hypothetical protein LBR49_03560, partial [Tannerella sp.]|nr:hypothetical protein [Tannerella sp.]